MTSSGRVDPLRGKLGERGNFVINTFVYNFLSLPMLRITPRLLSLSRILRPSIPLNPQFPSRIMSANMSIVSAKDACPRKSRPASYGSSPAS